MNRSMTIELADLHFFAPHGVHAEEALTGNEFKVSIRVTFTPAVTLITSIDETISYADVFNIAKTTFSEREKLLETCAMKISEKIYSRYPQVTFIQISIQKLSAPLLNFSGTAGIIYTQSF
jgi:7,8-dihydroneopterin aldolase/epimerase/oxygenase